MLTRGFTLLETLIAIGLIILLVSLGAVFSASYVRGAQLRATADLLNADVIQAQSDAYFQLNDRAHGVKLFTDHLIRFEGDSYMARISAQDQRTDFPFAIDISENDDEVVFPNGSVAPSSGAILTISRGTTAYDLTVTSYGVITLTSRTIGN